MRDVRKEISKEEFEKLRAMPHAERRKYIAGTIPLEWTYGYGYYGNQLIIEQDKYYIVHHIGNTCD